MTSCALPDLPCLCATLRRASRLVTARYEEALRPLGLTIMQFTILQSLSRMGEITQGQLAAVLALDSTTLTRNLSRLVQSGSLHRRTGSDRREWYLCLTQQGRQELETALPFWEQVQEELQHDLGPAQWAESFQMANRLGSAAHPAGKKEGTK